MFGTRLVCLGVASGGMKVFVTQWGCPPGSEVTGADYIAGGQGLDAPSYSPLPHVDTYNAEITACLMCARRTNSPSTGERLVADAVRDGDGAGPAARDLERALRLIDLDGAPRVEIVTPRSSSGHGESESTWAHLKGPAGGAASCTRTPRNADGQIRTIREQGGRKAVLHSRRARNRVDCWHEEVSRRTSTSVS